MSSASSTINTICKNCGYDLSQYPATVEIDRDHRSLYCPICGSEIHKIDEILDRDIFYDGDSGTYFKWVSSVQAGTQTNLIELIQIGNLIIKISSKPFDYRKIFYDAVLVFVRDGNQPAYSDELFKHQLFAPPENYSRYGIDLGPAKMQPNGNYLEVKFRLKGSSNELFIVLPAVATKPVPHKDINQTNSSWLKVWPDFKRPAESPAGYQRWADYFVFFDTKDSSINPEWIRVIGESPSEDVRLTRKNNKSPIKGELDFPPEYIEISAGVSRPGNPTKVHKASFKVKLGDCKTPNPGKPLRLSVDFGTSNTCFCFSVPGRGVDDWEEPVPLKLHDRTLTIIDGVQVANNPVNTWLPDLRDPNAKNPTTYGQTLLPSELVFFEEPLESMRRAGELKAVVDYTIPSLEWRKGEEAFISTGFKWKQATEPSNVANYNQDLQKMYLGLAFRLALAELTPSRLSSANVDPGNIDLYITYPLSMSNAEYEKLQGSYDMVRKEIKERTGINIEAKGFVNESYAAENAYSTGGGKHKIYVDVGGGTTDVSIVEPISVNSQESRPAQIVDSVRYAGNDFLMVLANDDPSSDNQQGTNEESKKPGGKISNVSLIELQRRMRADKKVLSGLSIFGGNKMRQDEAIIALDKFLDGLIEYLARLVAWKTKELVERLGVGTPEVQGAKDERINIHLIGNGWRFLVLPYQKDQPDLSDNDDSPDVSPIITQIVEERMNKVLKEYLDSKHMEVKPILEFNHPPEGKTIVAIGALKPQAESDSGIRDENLDSILGSNIVLVASNGEQEIHSWHEKIPFKVNNGVPPRSIAIRKVTNFEQDKVPDYRFGNNPIAPLDKIDISMAIHSKPKGKIIGNAFNVYLERWHKRFLHPKGWF